MKQPLTRTLEEKPLGWNQKVMGLKEKRFGSSVLLDSLSRFRHLSSRKRVANGIGDLKSRTHAGALDLEA